MDFVCQLYDKLLKDDSAELKARITAIEDSLNTGYVVVEAFWANERVEALSKGFAAGQ